MSEFEAETFDPHKRRLCPDGSCVGLLAADGTCRTCNRHFPNVAPASAGTADDLAAWENGPDGPNSGHHTGEHGDFDGLTGAGFDPTRRLCVDGGCVGVLDTHGRCGECGRVDTAEPPAAG